MPYREGDWWLQDDRTGRKILASDSVREWTGSIVHKDHAIDRYRHPQEIPRPIIDRQSVANPRPRGIDTFIGPLTTDVTAAAAAGATSIAVTSSVRFGAADSIVIMLATGDLFRTVVTVVSDGTHIEFSPALATAVEVGAAVIDFTAVAASDIA